MNDSEYIYEIYDDSDLYEQADHLGYFRDFESAKTALLSITEDNPMLGSPWSLSDCRRIVLAATRTGFGQRSITLIVRDWDAKPVTNDEDCTDYVWEAKPPVESLPGKEAAHE